MVGGWLWFSVKPKSSCCNFKHILSCFRERIPNSLGGIIIQLHEQEIIIIRYYVQKNPRDVCKQSDVSHFNSNSRPGLLKALIELQAHAVFFHYFLVRNIPSLYFLLPYICCPCWAVSEVIRRVTSQWECLGMHSLDIKEPGMSCSITISKKGRDPLSAIIHFHSDEVIAIEIYKFPPK